MQEEPFALEPGSTVEDLAREIHNDLATACRGGRLWGRNARFPGQEIGRGHVLLDGDVVELVRAR